MARGLADDASEESQAETKVPATSPQPTPHGDTGIQAVSHRCDGRSLPPWPLCKHSDSAACKKGKVTHIAEGAVEIPGCASQGTKVHTLFRVRLGGAVSKTPLPELPA